MKLRFKQKFFSWFDSFDVYDENGNFFYKVKGQLAWGHKFKIYDKYDVEKAELTERIFTFKHRFIMSKEDIEIGEIVKEITFFTPRFTITNGYSVTGNWLEWDYEVFKDNIKIASINKELFNWTDTYIIEVSEEDALIVLMIVLAIDAIKCDHGNY